MSTQLTENEVKKVYDTLEKANENNDREKLAKASEETNSTEYSNIEEMKSPKIIGVDFASENNKDVSVERIINASEITEEGSKENMFEEYGLSTEEANEVLKLISEYNTTNVNVTGLYDKLPEKLKEITNGIVTESKLSGQRISKDNAAKFIIDSFINDIDFDNILDEYNREMNQIIAESNKEFQYIMKDSFDEIFERIDEIEAEDPEKAKTIRAIKSAFDDACSYSRLLDYIDHISAKKLNKFLNRYDEECIYFNKKVNTTDIKVPNITLLYPIIKQVLSGFTESQIKKFIIVICKSSYNLNMDNIVDISYIYRLINNIVSFKYTNDFESDFGKEIFGNITVVIQKIINL